MIGIKNAPGMSGKRGNSGVWLFNALDPESINRLSWQAAFSLLPPIPQPGQVLADGL